MYNPNFKHIEFDRFKNDSVIRRTRKLVRGYENLQTPMNPADPQHYKTKTMECRDIIKVMTEGLNGADAYYMGNVLKYLYRYADKNGTEDLAKAITYIGFLKGE